MGKVILIPNGEKIYAVPTEICEAYELEGEELAAALDALTPDIEGQCHAPGPWCPSGSENRHHKPGENGSGIWHPSPWKHHPGGWRPVRW